eukprot:7201824-Karenia_brevis.AAC.1
MYLLRSGTEAQLQRGHERAVEVDGPSVIDQSVGHEEAIEVDGPSHVELQPVRLQKPGYTPHRGPTCHHLPSCHKRAGQWVNDRGEVQSRHAVGGEGHPASVG